MEIVDSHFHLWDTNDLDYELFRDRPALQGSFRLARYEQEARACGVTGAILVEAASAGADPVAETEWLLREIEGSDFVRGFVGWAPLDEPKRLEAHLDWLQAKAGELLVGVRRSFEWEPDDFAGRREVVDGCRIAGERGLAVDLVLFSRSLRATVALVDACPETTFVLDHLGKPPIQEAVTEPWRSLLGELARHANVACKLSGLAVEAGANWRVDDLAPYVEHAIDCFPRDRLLWGSDWPLVDLAGGYARWFDTVRSFGALDALPRVYAACDDS